MSESNETAKHTPERMIVSDYAVPGECVQLVDPKGRTIFQAWDWPESLGNARRLAACWNALQDFPTEAIELIAAQPNAITRVSAVYCVANQVGDRVAESMPSAEYEAALAGSAELGAKLALDIQPVLDAEFGELRDDERAEVLKSASSA